MCSWGGCCFIAGSLSKDALSWEICRTRKNQEQLSSKKSECNGSKGEGNRTEAGEARDRVGKAVAAWTSGEIVQKYTSRWGGGEVLRDPETRFLPVELRVSVTEVGAPGGNVEVTAAEGKHNMNEGYSAFSWSNEGTELLMRTRISAAQSEMFC
jgi:hypothetical protein